MNSQPLQFSPLFATLRIMNQDTGNQGGTAVHRIELNLKDMNQLFNTMDPSPFHEKDLDRDAEEFIVSWAREFAISEPVKLVVHLSELPREKEPQTLIEHAVQNYFGYRSRINGRDFRHLMRDGRQSLLIGLLFLATCLTISNLLASQAPGTFLDLVRESLSIAGWVAMWRPMEIYLYEWWPLRRRARLFEKLSRMQVELRQHE
jgi:hypothetical protein